MQVSILIPIYNTEKYLSECLESLINQTFKDFEIICVDDRSTDRSYDILKEYEQKDNRIKIFKNDQNIGTTKTLNVGLSKIDPTSKYIARMDGDDICLPTRIEDQVKFMDENTDIDICGTWAQKLKDGELGRVIKEPLNHNDILLRIATNSTPFIHPSIMFRKSFIDRNNIKYNEEWVRAQDYELYSRCYFAHNAKFANLPKILIKYRVHSDQISTKKKRNEEQREINRKKFIKALPLNLKIKSILMYFCKKIRRKLIQIKLKDNFIMIKIFGFKLESKRKLK